MRRLCLALSLCFASCTTAPHAPDQEVRPAEVGWVHVTVRVLTYHSERPIADALILRDSEAVGVTDASGLFVFRVPRGSAVRLQATKPGYAPSLAALGEVTGEGERWTFYLERLAEKG